MTTCENMSDYMEVLARKQRGEPPAGYGYKADLSMNVGFFREEQSGVKLLEKPVVVPSGKPEFQGYMVLFAYSSEEGVTSLLQGALPPMLPATTKEPKSFASKAAIADNFGNKDAEASVKKGTSDYCVAFRVPSELATKVETPGRDLWIVRFDQDLVSPFLQAAKEGDAAILQKGVESGISGQTVDEHGVSALMMAAMKGSLESCKVLLDHGADVNTQEPTNSRTPLMFAAQGGFNDVVELMIGKNADPSKADSEGSTALMWAAVADKADTAKLLAGFGSTDLKNEKGQTALAVAEAMGHSATVAVLKG